MIVKPMDRFTALLAVCRFASVRTASNYMILSLSCADLLMSVKMPIALYNGYYGGPELGVSGAKVSSDV